MSEQTETARAIGQLEGTVGTLQTQVAGMDTKLDTVVAYIEQQKGEKRATKFVAAAISTVVGGLAALAVDWFHK